MKSAITLIRSVSVALLAYVLIDGPLGMLLQSALPGETDGRGHSVGLPLMLGDLTIHGIALFAAGALAASTTSESSPRGAFVASAAVFAFVLGLTLALWDAEPAWFDIACLLMTPPFQLLGSAWHRAAGKDPHA